MMGLRAILAEVMTTMIARIATIAIPIAARQTRIVGTATRTAVTIIVPLTDIARIVVGRVITATAVMMHTTVIPVLREPMLMVFRIADHRTGIETGTMGLLTRRGDLPSIGPTKVHRTLIRTFTMGRLVITGVTRLTFRDKPVDRITETSRIAAPTADLLIAG
jgi:hypothetical protein